MENPKFESVVRIQTTISEFAVEFAPGGDSASSFKIRRYRPNVI